MKKRFLSGLLAFAAFAICLPIPTRAQSVPYQEPIWVITGSPEGRVKAPAGSVYLDGLSGSLYVKTTQSYLQTGWSQIAGTNGASSFGTITITNKAVFENKSVTDSNYPYTVLTQGSSGSQGNFKVSRQNRSGGTNDPASDQIAFQLVHVLGLDVFGVTFPTLFYSDVQVNGTLYAQGAIRTHGAVIGAINTYTANHTVSVLSDATCVADVTSNDVTFTLPTAASAYDSLTSTGNVFDFPLVANPNSHSMIITAAGAELISGIHSRSYTSIGTTVTVQSTGTTWVLK